MNILKEKKKLFLSIFIDLIIEILNTIIFKKEGVKKDNDTA